MRRLPKARTWAILLLTLGFFGVLTTELARESPRNGMRRTQPIRENRAQLREILRSLERQLDAVHGVNESEQILLMQAAVGTLKNTLLPHLTVEDSVLYPAADRQIPASSAASIQVMRQEHEIMRRWIAEMEALADASMPDHNAFARRGERLLGLIEAHFEVEEAVLFPVLDQAAPLTRNGRRPAINR